MSSNSTMLPLEEELLKWRKTLPRAVITNTKEAEVKGVRWRTEAVAESIAIAKKGDWKLLKRDRAMIPFRCSHILISSLTQKFPIDKVQGRSMNALKTEWVGKKCNLLKIHRSKGPTLEELLLRLLEVKNVELSEFIKAKRNMYQPIKKMWEPLGPFKEDHMMKKDSRQNLILLALTVP